MKGRETDMNAPILAVLAKKPVPGLAKTRLCSDCSIETAAKIARSLIEHTLQTASSGWPGPIRLLMSPDDEDKGLRQVADNAGIKMCKQGPGDLGLKMAAAIRDGLESGSPVGLTGSDIPSMTPEHFRCAYEQLEQGRNVLGPSADGGFYFIGAQSCVFELFRDMHWSTSNVAQTIIERAKLQGFNFDFILECLQDVDTWDDFRVAARQLPELRQYLAVQSDMDRSSNRKSA